MTESNAEATEKNRATNASNSWLEKVGNKTKRWIGHGVRLVGTEFVITIGSLAATAGAIGTVLTGGAVSPILLMGAGGIATGLGVKAEWEMGMKHANSGAEKKAFVLSKLAQAAAPAVSISNPGIANGMYLAGVGMGARAMSHRK